MSSNIKDEVPDAHTCYICQLQVPAASKSRHEGSYLHRACLKIASTALQRLRAHVTPVLSVEPVATEGGFGQQQATGTAHVKYNPVIGCDVVVNSGTSHNVSVKDHCITCMKEYEGKSLEELRLEDYAAGRKTGAAAGGVFGGFSQQTENKPLFGATQNDRDTSLVSFCGACASVYPSIDNKHIRTKTHLMAALDDQVFDELVRGYVGEEGLLEASKDPCDEEALRTVDASEAADTYTCYICALEIPKTYKIEHELSSRHRTCVALADAARQRTIAFLTPPQIRVENEKKPTKNLEDKMVALLKAYTGVDIKKQEIETEEELEDSKDEDIPIEEKRLTPKEYFSDVIPYLQYIGGFYTLIIDDTDHVTIKIENGTYMRVHIVNFNGIYNVGETKDCYMKCKMCDGFFENMSYSSAGNMDKLHVMSLGHIKNVLSPIKSVHGIREIDNTHSLCVLCNVLIHSHNVEKHTMRDIKHTAFLAEALEKGKRYKESEKDIKFIIYTPPVSKTGWKIPSNFNSVLQHSSFGHNGHNSGALFGSTQPSAFGKTSGSNAIGQNQSSLGIATKQSGLGQSGNSVHGSSNQTGLGQNSDLVFGQTQQSAQGTKPTNTALGSFWSNVAKNCTLGQTSQQTNVNSKQNVFGQNQSGIFGKATQALGNSGTFGQGFAGFGQTDQHIPSPFGHTAQADTNKSELSQPVDFHFKLT